MTVFNIILASANVVLWGHELVRRDFGRRWSWLALGFYTWGILYLASILMLPQRI